jgi:phosphoribosyl 1,2-cyclic phosphodiesterase
MQIKVIGTGSSGNSYILSNAGRSLLLDAGVKIKQIKAALDFDISTLDAALITHEHQDHAQAVPDLVRTGIPIYLSDGTATVLLGSQPHSAISHHFGVYMLGDWAVKPFDVEHDAVEPKGFLIYNIKTLDKIVYLTDTGFTKFVPVLPTVLILECSYTDEILDRNQVELGVRYIRLKKHHFSLKRVLDFLMAIDRANLRHIVLVHLSATNSNANLMIDAIRTTTGITPVIAKAGLTIDLS